MPEWLELKNAEYELKQDEFYYDIDFEAKKDLLDTIIAEELNDYYILELGHVSPENRYLNEKDQMDLIGKITAKVFVNRMTPAVLANLSFYYKFNTEEDLQRIIARRVSFAVLGLTLDTNTMNIPNSAFTEK